MGWRTVVEGIAALNAVTFPTGRSSRLRTVDGRPASGVPASSTSLAVHSAYHGASPPTPTGNSRLGAMTAGKRTVDCRRHAGSGPAHFGRAPSWLHVAGRVGGPVAGEDGRAHLDLRRPPGARRRASRSSSSSRINYQMAACDPPI